MTTIACRATALLLCAAAALFVCLSSFGLTVERAAADDGLPADPKALVSGDEPSPAPRPIQIFGDATRGA